MDAIASMMGNFFRARRQPSSNDIRDFIELLDDLSPGHLRRD
jgi:hypothetical protein